MKPFIEKLREADARQAVHNKLSTTQKIEKARSRRGESKKEIDRLSKNSLA